MDNILNIFAPPPPPHSTLVLTYVVHYVCYVWWKIAIKKKNHLRIVKLLVLGLISNL